MTKVTTLEAALKSDGSRSALMSDGGPQPKKTRFDNGWQFERKGDKIHKDGRDWYWCDHESHRRNPSDPNRGMYCSTHGNGHLEHTHESFTRWKKETPDWRNKLKEKSDRLRTANKSQSGPSSSGISLNEKLKNALLTKTACTEADIAALSQQDF